MFPRVFLLIIFVFSSIESKRFRRFGDDEEFFIDKNQRLLVDVVIYDRPYVLPYFLANLEDLKCPVNECFLDLHLDFAESQTTKLVRQWIDAMPRRNFVSIEIVETKNRFDSSIERSRNFNVTFLSMFDSMMILLNTEKLLSTLISKDKPLMSPLLRSTRNYFTSTFYLRDENFRVFNEIYSREKLGCFLLDGGIKDFYFLNLIKSKFDSFYDVPNYVCNRENFGYLTAQIDDDESKIEEIYTNTLIEHQLNGPSQTYLPSIRRSSLISFETKRNPTKFGFDEIFVINLRRRSDRRERLETTFDILNVDVRFFDAIDGKTTINGKYLEELGVRLLPNYEDPYNRRPMNYGELGCFFSHFFIWKEIVEKNFSNGVLIFEDDVRFDPFFKSKLERVFSNRSFDWDLIYLGRKLMRPDEENFDEIFQDFLVKPSYSHWTVAYALSYRGAKILLEQNPLEKILPVDEFLPIMFDRHPNFHWKKFFDNRILKTFAFQPTIVAPTHFFGEPNYISDTENTTILRSTNEKSFQIRDEL